MKSTFLDDLDRASSRQLHAPIYDILQFSRPWGFSLRDVHVPIRFWHGDADPIVPLVHAEHMAALVPEAALRVRPGEGHPGISTRHTSSWTRSSACGTGRPGPMRENQAGRYPRTHSSRVES
jgi:fermentation-respiration switch protein FrsA (DUF1100 family)